MRAATAQSLRLTRIVTALASEAGAAETITSLPGPDQIAGASASQQRYLLDFLLTVRPATPLDEGVHRDLDVLLEEKSVARARAAGNPDALRLPTLAQTHGVRGVLGENVALWRGDLTTLRAGAIVNAANSAMLGCRVPGHTCIDNAVHAAAGPGLRAECARYMSSRQDRPEETGKALLTGGYHLPAGHVIHTVGPIVQGEVGQEHRELLASSYRSVLDVAASRGLDSIGLCSVSTGVFGYPKEEAAPLVLATTEQWLRSHAGLRIVICLFAEVDVAAYEKALS